jgi:hypothetical protein
LPVSKTFERSIFNFNLKLVKAALSWRHHKSWRQKRPENESERIFYEIRPFGRLQISRFR